MVDSTRAFRSMHVQAVSTSDCSFPHAGVDHFAGQPSQGAAAGGGIRGGPVSPVSSIPSGSPGL